MQYRKMAKHTKKILTDVLFDVMSKERCPECGSNHIIYDMTTYEHICGDCGLITKTEEIKVKQEFVFR